MRVLPFGLLLVLISGFSIIFIYISTFSNFLNANIKLSDQDLQALDSLRTSFQQCVSANGLGLQAVLDKDYCQVTMKFPDETISKWSDPKSGEVEGLSHEFNLCEAVATWEQVRNSTTVLTKEYIDALPNGWEDYAWKRINKGIQLNNCKNKSLCMEKLSLVLPKAPPYSPKQFDRCAVVGNSADLLKTKFGKEIDSYDAIFRQNGAPIQNYSDYVGSKSTFRLLNRGSAKALDKVAELYDAGKEALLVKTTIHDIMSKMIREIPILNPVYLMLGTSFGSSAKGTGLKALESALSICDSVDIYGFTVDPGYEEWTRYFSESRGGHTPLHGRAYYQMMECLGLIKIHSPMRADPNRVVKWLPSQSIVAAARIASEKILAQIGMEKGCICVVCCALAPYPKSTPQATELFRFVHRQALSLIPPEGSGLAPPIHSAHVPLYQSSKLTESFQQTYERKHASIKNTSKVQPCILWSIALDMAYSVPYQVTDSTLQCPQGLTGHTEHC